MVMRWHRVTRANPAAARLADRHYSRQTVGSPQFTPPGRVLCLLTDAQDALWATSWPYAQYVNRESFPDAWVCTIFRNESPILSSELILEAVAATRAVWGQPPASGMVTMVDIDKVRRKRDPGRCFRKAGFVPCGYTKERGLLVLRIAPEHMPPPIFPDVAQMPLLEIPA